jgi:hypothetical protein
MDEVIIYGEVNSGQFLARRGGKKFPFSEWTWVAAAAGTAGSRGRHTRMKYIVC